MILLSLLTEEILKRNKIDQWSMKPRTCADMLIDGHCPKELMGTLIDTNELLTKLDAIHKEDLSGEESSMLDRCIGIAEEMRGK